MVQFVSIYGVWLVAGLIALESVGIPVPAEAALIAAAFFGATTHELNICFLISAGIIAAIAGEIVGFWIASEQRTQIRKRKNANGRGFVISDLCTKFRSTKLRRKMADQRTRAGPVVLPQYRGPPQSAGHTALNRRGRTQRRTGFNEAVAEGVGPSSKEASITEISAAIDVVWGILYLHYVPVVGSISKVSA